MIYRHGFARVSASAQDPQLQLDALHPGRVDRIHVDRAPGVATHGPEFNEILDNAQPGDTVVVWRLDGLGRSRKHAIGRLVRRLLSALASFERDLLAERTRAEPDVARKQGGVSGRPKPLPPAAEQAASVQHHGGRTSTQIAQTLRASGATTYRHKQRVNSPISAAEAEG